MSNKIFVRRPQLGDYVCKRVSDRKVFYLDWQSADCPEGNMFEVDGETYEKIGSAVPYEGDKVLCLWRETAAKPFCERYMFRLTGYVLDGAEHTSTLSIREASNGWGTAVDYDITYAATTVADFVAQLNAYFAATEVFSAAVQDWWAEVDDEGVVVNCKFINSPQGSNAGENGFALSIFSAYPFTSEARLANGASMTSFMANFFCSINFYQADINSVSFNPTTPVTTVALVLPVCLPAYLGTSTYRDGDMCAYLRSVYGEGEEGWMKFLASFFAVKGTGAFAVESGKSDAALTTYSTSALTDEPLYPAAIYCHEVSTSTVERGEFWLPTAREFVAAIAAVKYGYETDRNADALNAARNKAGWDAISNINNFWLSSVYNPSFTYSYYKGEGRISAYTNSIRTKITILPVTQYQL